MALFVLLLLVVFCHHDADAQCKFPASLEGTWRGNKWTGLRIDNTTIQSIVIEGKAFSFSCFSVNGSQYIIKSSDFSMYKETFNHYVCLDLSKSTASNDVYYYHVRTEESELHGNATVVTIMRGKEFTVSDVCNSNNTLLGDDNILFREGAEETVAAYSCPVRLQALFQANFSDEVSQTKCPLGFEVDGCSNRSALSFNYSDCGGVNSYSGSVEYLCILTLEDLDANYTTVYHPPSTESNPYFPFSCMQQSDVNGTLTIIHSAGRCGESPSEQLTLQETDMCPSEIMTTQTPKGEDNSTEDSGRNTTFVPQNTTDGGDDQGGGGKGEGSGGVSICEANADILTLLLPALIGIMWGIV